MEDSPQSQQFALWLLSDVSGRTTAVNLAQLDYREIVTEAQLLSPSSRRTQQGLGVRYHTAPSTVRKAQVTHR